MALKSGLNRGYYGDVERGERKCLARHILRIAAALEILASQILADAEKLLRKRS